MTPRVPQPDATVATARITAWQAIIVAAITGLVSITTTLIATGKLLPDASKKMVVSVGATAEKPPATGASPAVLDGPEFAYRPINTDLSFEECIRRGREAFVRSGFTGVGTSSILVYGRHDDYTGGILCYTEVGRIIFIAAGKDFGRTERERETLWRSF